MGLRMTFFVEERPTRMPTVPLRDDGWLEERRGHLWNAYYGDARAGYPIVAKFGPRARYRFGSIFSHNKTCRILVNGLFAHPEVPEYVVDATLVHEMAHYIHGYGSGLRRLHAHPHRGGVVDNEMRARGCYHLEEKARAWRKTQWPAFYESHAADIITRNIDRDRTERARWSEYLSTAGFRTEAQVRSRLAELALKFSLSEPPFGFEWLLASQRRRGLSYRFPRENVVRLHALLAAPTVPDAVIDYELCYWLAAHMAGNRWQAIEQALRTADVWESAEKAIRWRRRTWPKFLAARHPLRSG
jgi:hypothetical protein